MTFATPRPRPFTVSFRGPHGAGPLAYAVGTATMRAAIPKAVGFAVQQHGWRPQAPVDMIWGPTSPVRCGSRRTGREVPGGDDDFAWHDRRGAEEPEGVPPRTPYGECPCKAEHHPDYRVGSVVTVLRFKNWAERPAGSGYAQKCERYTDRDIAYVRGIEPESSQRIDQLREAEYERLQRIESVPTTTDEFLDLMLEVAVLPVYAGAHRH